jgi:hypothetical protein
MKTQKISGSLPSQGANPTIVSYDAKSSLVRSESKSIFFDFAKRSSLLQHTTLAL